MIHWKERKRTVGELNPDYEYKDAGRVTSIEYSLMSGSVRFAFIKTVETDQEGHPRLVGMSGKLGVKTWAPAHSKDDFTVPIEEVKAYAEKRMELWLVDAELMVKPQ